MIGGVIGNFAGVLQDFLRVGSHIKEPDSLIRILLKPVTTKIPSYITKLKIIGKRKGTYTLTWSSPIQHELELKTSNAS